MRFGHYAAAILGSCLAADVVAKPVVKYPGRPGRMGVKPKVDVSKNKYFHEPGGDETLGHYDARYFKGVVTYDERTDTQLHMIRAYLKFFRDHGLDTWIAHGTLLGWWWNGKRLPWDFDLDTQVSAATLHFLGENFNMTRQHYVSDDGETTREYLVDVNPWIWQRERGDGMNIIDARWIDVRNGLFIDITGLAETHPDQSPGVWSCKNYHRYHTSDLYPMRESIFEGVPAKIPYSYDKILIEEYQEKALILTEYQGHKWDSDVKEWVKTQAQIEKDKKFEEEQAAKKAEEEKKAQEEAENKAREEEEAKQQEEQARQEAESPNQETENEEADADGNKNKVRDLDFTEKLGM